MAPETSAVAISAAVTALVGGGGAVVLGRLARGRPSVAAFAAPLVVVLALTAGVAVATRSMLIQENDYRTMLFVLLAGAPVALAIGLLLARRVSAAEQAAAAERVRGAQERARAEQALALEASRRETITWIGHDLRTPLTGVRLLAESLLETAIPADARESSAGAHHASNSVATEPYAARSGVASPAVDSSAVDSSVVDSSAVDPGAVDPSNVGPGAVDPSNVDPSNVGPSAVDPSVVDASAAAARIVREVDRLDAMVDDLTMLSRLQSPGLPTPDVRTLDEVDLDDLVSDAVASVAPLAHDSGVAIVSGTLAGGVIRANPSHLGRAVTNLVRNAVQHTPSGSAVVVATGPGVVTVRDACGGIPEQDLPQLTTPGWRGDGARSGGGMGLGLTIAAEVARAHGGSVAITNLPDGSGCVAILTL